MRRPTKMREVPGLPELTLTDQVGSTVAACACVSQSTTRCSTRATRWAGWAARSRRSGSTTSC